MDQKLMIVFKKDQIKELLSDLDVNTKKIEDKEYVLDEYMNVAECPVCEKEITVERVGNIAKGSRIIFCDNPACFATHLSKQIQ